MSPRRRLGHPDEAGRPSAQEVAAVRAGLPVPGIIWSSLPVPAFLIDESDLIGAANPAAEIFLNSSARALLGVPVLDRLAIDAPMEEALARVRANQADLFINDVDVGTGDRAPVLCNLQMAPLAEAPEIVLMLIAPRDIAGRLTQGEPGLSGVRSAIGMADMLAHEIKNPLAGIAGAAQLLSMNLENGDRELTELIVEETRRVVKLLDQVEEFGRLTPPDLQPVNIHDVLRRARRSAMLGFAAHMRVIEDYDPSLPPVLADSDQLVQVVLNLLKNASEAAGPGGGTIRIRSFYDIALRLRRRLPPGAPAPADDTARARASSTLPVQIEIIDDGPGIPPEIAANMFDPFVSGRENGTGLGLALVARIIGAHGAWISADSVPGRTVFRLSLPLATGGDVQETSEGGEG